MFRKRYGWTLGRNGCCIEEQRLRDCSLHRGPLERLGNQEGGFRTSARQQAFRESGDKNHWHGKFGKYVLNRIDSARIVSKLDVGEDEAWRLLPRLRTRSRSIPPLTPTTSR